MNERMNKYLDFLDYFELKNISERLNSEFEEDLGILYIVLIYEINNFIYIFSYYIYKRGIYDKNLCLNKFKTAF